MDTLKTHHPSPLRVWALVPCILLLAFAACKQGGKTVTEKKKGVHSDSHDSENAVTNDCTNAVSDVPAETDGHDHEHGLRLQDEAGHEHEEEGHEHEEEALATPLDDCLPSVTSTPDTTSEIPGPSTSTATNVTKRGEPMHSCQEQGLAWIPLVNGDPSQAGCGESLVNWCCTAANVQANFPEGWSLIASDFEAYQTDGHKLYHCSTDGNNKTTFHFAKYAAGKTSYRTVFLSGSKGAGTSPATCTPVLASDMGFVEHDEHDGEEEDGHSDHEEDAGHDHEDEDGHADHDEEGHEEEDGHDHEDDQVEIDEGAVP